MLQPKMADGLRPTLIDFVCPTSSAASAALLVVTASLLIAMGAQLKFLIPGTPVPITGQTLAVLYVGALLGAKRGAAAVALYLAEGAFGLPFFSGGGAGAAHLIGPTGGYLVGFLPAAYVTGALAQRGWDRRPITAFAMMFVGSLVLFAFGLAGLARFFPVEQLPAMGLLPFVPGDLVKCAASAALLPLGWKLLGRR